MEYAQFPKEERKNLNTCNVYYIEFIKNEKLNEL